MPEPWDHKQIASLIEALADLINGLDLDEWPSISAASWPSVLSKPPSKWNVGEVRSSAAWGMKILLGFQVRSAVVSATSRRVARGVLDRSKESPPCLS
jgi:hypothetical protein